jgi:hypothetical protein
VVVAVPAIISLTAFSAQIERVGLRDGQKCSMLSNLSSRRHSDLASAAEVERLRNLHPLGSQEHPSCFRANISLRKAANSCGAATIILRAKVRWNKWIIVWPLILSLASSPAFN